VSTEAPSSASFREVSASLSRYPHASLLQIREPLCVYSLLYVKAVKQDHQHLTAQCTSFPPGPSSNCVSLR
jgi:hypothetical protein